MMFAHGNRLLFGTAALLCYAAAIVLAPVGARSQFAPQTQLLNVAEPRVEPAPPAIVPERDAFAPRATIDDDPSPALPATPPQLPRLPAPRVVSVLPPVAIPSHVTAIVTGTHPTAIVGAAEGARLVSVGDALDGSSILQITSDSVVLANGKRLTLEPVAKP